MSWYMICFFKGIKEEVEGTNVWISGIQTYSYKKTEVIVLFDNCDRLSEFLK